LKPEADPAILGRQVELLYRNLRLGQIMSVLNASFLIWVASPTVSGLALGTWWLLATLVALGRIRLAAAFHRHPDEVRLAAIALWHRRALLGALISGLIWAGGTVLLMAAGNTTLQLFTAFVMAGMVAGAVPVLAADRRIFRSFAWPIVLAVAVSAFGLDALHIALTTMSLLFLMIATRSADYFHQTLLESLRLQREKDALVAKLERAREIAEQSDRAKTEFLANISHELRTPLNGIVGLGELLDLEALTPEQQELLTPLRRSADDLMRMIGNLIELSSLEAGHIKPQSSAFITTELAESLLSGHRTAARDRGLELRETIDPALPQIIVGDITRLRQVFAHLLGNAIKFTERGHVEVAIRLQDTTPERSLIEFCISDSGPGIAPEKLRLLSGLLVQGDGSSIRRHGGIGVGLPIARKLIELLGGELNIESESGVGSRFRFSLPFAHRIEDEASPSASTQG